MVEAIGVLFSTDFNILLLWKVYFGKKFCLSSTHPGFCFTVAQKHSVSIAFWPLMLWSSDVGLFLPCFHNLHPFCPLKANCTEVLKLLSVH